MNTKILTSLFAGALMFALAGVAQADPIYMDFGVGGGLDGHADADGAADPDQVTETFNQYGVFANTTTTQFDTDGSGSLTDGDKFSDNGHLNVTGLIPGGAGDNEGLNAISGYQLTAEWNGLTGTATALTDNGDGTSTGNIAYDAVNTTFNFYVDDRSGALATRTNFNYGGDIGSDDDVDGTFTDGVLVLSVLITGGAGTNVFDNLTGAFLRGTSTLVGEVTFALEDFIFFADGDQDINDLIASLIKISVFIDQNTDNVETVAGPCGDGDDTTVCNPGDPLFIVDSDHDGSMDLVRIPEPASVLLFGLGFLALGGITLVARRQHA
jgi:hypothetical protein